MKPSIHTLILADGEHYLPNLESALRKLEETVCVDMVLFIGGIEKIGSFDRISEQLDFPIEPAFTRTGPDMERLAGLFSKHRADRVIDLSDEPVLDYPGRLYIANLALHYGMTYQGADFFFTPPRFADILTKPSIALWGTGKRIGKTAMGGFTARALQRAGRQPAVVTLSRGGPGKPYLLRGDRIHLSPESLLEFTQKGLHAASDYVEDAVTGRCITIGCRRCGGGLAGAPYFSIVGRGAQLAESHPDVDVVILEGSGATLPDVRAGKTVLLVSVVQDPETVKNYFGPYRVMGADLVILCGCERPLADRERVRIFTRIIRDINPDVPVAKVVLRPSPLKDIRGKKVFYATTAPECMIEKMEAYLAGSSGCTVVGSTAHLSYRDKLDRDIRDSAEGADVFLTEVKASAVDTVFNLAKTMNKDVVFCDNVPEVVEGSPVTDLEKAILDLSGVC